MRKLKNEELERLNVTEFKASTKLPLILILDDIRSLNNVGSVFRSADAFLVEKIYLCGITGRPPHKDIQKTALGATESVEWEYAPDCHSLIQKLKSDGVLTFALEQVENSTLLSDWKIDHTKQYALVLGNEVKGVQQEVVSACNGSIEIPQFGTKHSLNISVSAGVAIWEFWRKFNS